jgi:hypothetical protein
VCEREGEGESSRARASVREPRLTPSSFAGVRHTRAVIGHGAARAVAQSAKVAGHTLRRPCAAPNARDALLFPATVPSGGGPSP